MATVREGQSGFDGGLAGTFGLKLGNFLLLLISLGFAYPWTLCRNRRWDTRHTVIDGRRLRFDGTGAGLIGAWVRIWLLTLVTLGIYWFWGRLAVRRWVAERTHFEAVG